MNYFGGKQRYCLVATVWSTTNKPPQRTKFPVLVHLPMSVPRFDEPHYPRLDFNMEETTHDYIVAAVGIVNKGQPGLCRKVRLGRLCCSVSILRN